jgi:uracil phosphoribosyltransferase
MKKVLLSVLRDKNTDIKDFRSAAYKLSSLLAGQLSDHLEKASYQINTPTGNTNGLKIKNDIVFIPILRSAIAMVDVFIKFFEYAKVGYLGLKRDEKTAIPQMYYKNLPEIKNTDDVVILDPMIATGGSGAKAIEILKENGVLEEKIIFVAIICSKFGVEHIKKLYPKIKIIFVAQDEVLNNEKFIVPGLGDFGDRFFGTL